jgi:hypothetical protein
MPVAEGLWPVVLPSALSAVQPGHPGIPEHRDGSTACPNRLGLGVTFERASARDG